MTTELGYSFYDVESGLKIASNLMNRAVRVKQTVKDKVARIFNTKMISVKSVKPTVQNEVTTNEEVKAGGIEHLIDLSELNISNINSKVDSLVKQGKVEAKANRAVLFTSSLLNKIKKVALKWFGGNKETESVENVTAVKVENPSPIFNKDTNVIPSTWATEDALKQTENQSIPTFSPIIENEVKENNNEKPVSQVEAPVLPSIASFVPTDENEKTQEIVEKNEEVSTPEEIKPEVNIPEEPVIPTITPLVENPTEEEDNKNEEEKKEETVVNTSEFVQEPTDLNTVQQVQEKPAEQEETKMSAEDKIAQLLNRNFNNVEQVEEEKPSINQAYILAKLQRIGTDSKAKDAKLKTLGDKVSSLEEDNRDLKSKLGDSEVQVKELSTKNARLEEQVEKLTSANTNIENEHRTEVESLNVKIEEMSKARREEHEEAKRKEEKMQSEHNREIEELKQAHAEEIRRLNEANEKKIEAIYRTIANALGESVQEGKSL